MDGPALMARMARNNAWANARLHGAVAGLNDEAIWRPRRAAFFGSIGAALRHILDVDLYYIAALEGRPDRSMFDTPRDPADFAGEQQAADRRLTALCDALTPERLGEDIPTDRGTEGIVAENCAELLLHLFQHQIHHRGQVHAMLTEAGASPPQLDEFHLRYDRHPTAAEFDP